MIYEARLRAALVRVSLFLSGRTCLLAKNAISKSKFSFSIKSAEFFWYQLFKTRVLTFAERMEHDPARSRFCLIEF